MPNYKNYPRDVLETCETTLKEGKVPQWFIDRFVVADGVRQSMDWGSVRSLSYLWPIPLVTSSAGTYTVDIRDQIEPELWQTLELVAVARAWLACFGERSPWELALVYEFAHLDARRTQKWITSDQASANAQKAVDKQRKELEFRDNLIKFDALKLIEDGTPLHKLVSELTTDEAFTNDHTGKPLSGRQIRTILKNAGILK